MSIRDIDRIDESKPHVFVPKDFSQRSGCALCGASISSDNHAHGRALFPGMATPLGRPPGIIGADEHPRMHWFPYGGSPRSCPDTDGSSDYVTGNEKNVTCPACLANLAKSPTDDHATLVAYLLLCVKNRDYHGVSDAANDLRVLEAREEERRKKS